MIITIFKAPSNKTQMKEELLHLLQHFFKKPKETIFHPGKEETC